MTDKGYTTEFPAFDELRLRHLTVDEALPLLDEFIHDRFVSGLRSVRIIHGERRRHHPRNGAP
jgi:DNA-nicking Smr family endonuclease